MNWSEVGRLLLAVAAILAGGMVVAALAVLAFLIVVLVHDRMRGRYRL